MRLPHHFEGREGGREGGGGREREREGGEEREREEGGGCAASVLRCIFTMRCGLFL